VSAWVFFIVHCSHIPHLSICLDNSAKRKKLSILLQHLLGKLNEMVEQEVEVGMSHILNIESQSIWHPNPRFTFGVRVDPPATSAANVNIGRFSLTWIVSVLAANLPGA